jgi:hypothetical protein
MSSGIAHAAPDTAASAPEEALDEVTVTAHRLGLIGQATTETSGKSQR